MTIIVASFLFTARLGYDLSHHTAMGRARRLSPTPVETHSHVGRWSVQTLVIIGIVAFCFGFFIFRPPFRNWQKNGKNEKSYMQHAIC